MNNRAMSLLEIIVSMVILAVAALLVSSTYMFVKSERLRTSSDSTTAGSLDVQALNYARETLEALKNAVSTNATRAAPLSGSAGGTLHNSATDPTNPLIPLPAGGDLALSGGARFYTVWDIDADSDGVNDYKKVTVSVTWND